MTLCNHATDLKDPIVSADLGLVDPCTGSFWGILTCPTSGLLEEPISVAYSILILQIHAGSSYLLPGA